MDLRTAAREAALGVVGAMAMSGMRTVTSGLGLVGETPPKSIVEERAPRLVRGVPKERRRAVVELLHWTYGAFGGVVFAALPGRLRRRRWAGPVYGVAVWAGFEAGIAPALGLAKATQDRLDERLAFMADHVLYGFVVGSQAFAPTPVVNSL